MEVSNLPTGAKEMLELFCH